MQGTHKGATQIRSALPLAIAWLPEAFVKRKDGKQWAHRGSLVLATKHAANI